MLKYPSVWRLPYIRKQPHTRVGLLGPSFLRILNFLAADLVIAQNSIFWKKNPSAFSTWTIFGCKREKFETSYKSQPKSRIVMKSVAFLVLLCLVHLITAHEGPHLTRKYAKHESIACWICVAVLSNDSKLSLYTYISYILMCTYTLISDTQPITMARTSRSSAWTEREAGAKDPLVRRRGKKYSLSSAKTVFFIVAGTLIQRKNSTLPKVWLLRKV